ncbi:hypothetical protein DTS49_07535 [Salmonella enterica]|uniref:Uncharacterized protein n=1 Tax=Salmonella paratyphi B TaxID=57045 RepID=A0A736NSJ1_SALEB|nr:hypothetical protein [Salmonella enterica subsp. enterica serovar Paratyphi B]EAM2329237.1 hypothetical protein [Salmonella enterica]EBH2710796.1 hypothetical protein [Salmonella enterica subsp. enterica serovar Enteritidis]EDJ6459321.1 hypothetical protein [Salmonella enterica subsp. enterica]EDR6767533.1 hypothetical protein [Salmonella enterica subsp. enterica serovar Java]EDX4106460.1 hypothetical protein [Salmonella enterica subsp. enterica serovar Paratyphi B str. CFSAN000527]
MILHYWNRWHSKYYPMLPIGLPIGETPDFCFVLNRQHYCSIVQLFNCSNRPVALVMPTPPGHEICQIKRMKVKRFS